MSKKAHVVELIMTIVDDKTTAETIVERLQDEGLLVLGYGDNDTDAIVLKFSEMFGTTKVSKYDRFAANRLARKYGSQAVCGVIDLLAQNQSEKYAPVANSVVDLESKWVSIVNFLRNTRGTETIEV